MGLGNMEQRTGGMQRQAQELIKQAYNRGYTEGYSKAETDYHAKTEDDRQSSYELGLDVAWDAARKIMLDEGYSKEELGYIFSDYDNPLHAIDFHGILRDHSASEAIEKIKAYEEKKREEEETSDLHIGDEVTFLTIGGEIITGVITGEYHDTHEFRIMRATDGGECYCCKAKRTGRHFPEIAEVLKKMEEGENKE